ncbi:Ubiquitin-conjugating enzyme E2 32 [Dimargaris verticillata]|uniref:Ubiquitin-conjugating enzyme E2 32 n=1 Tax=Dimargaris verticillata TaxID=2761393 RepID=A0A9W8AXH7_9FUNG|nr:Ubiquitin-conjugating enzyme E2 32 [Dimargaris verticillata]
MPSPTVSSSSAVKRLMKEWRGLRKEPSALFDAAPLEDNLFEWHFTIRGQPDTDYAGGKYHGRILLPAEYPFKPPSVVFLTPNGRFQLHKKICLSMTQYHPEHWQPAWDIRCMLLGLISFMPSDVSNSIGDINYSPEERRHLAKQSLAWACPTCGVQLGNVLTADVGAEGSSDTQAKAEPGADKASVGSPDQASDGAGSSTTTTSAALASTAELASRVTTLAELSAAQTQRSSQCDPQPADSGTAGAQDSLPAATARAPTQPAPVPPANQHSRRREQLVYGLNKKQWDSLMVFVVAMIGIMCLMRL